jgi:hypothetical protein
LHYAAQGDLGAASDDASYAVAPLLLPGLSAVMPLGVRHDAGGVKSFDEYEMGELVVLEPLIWDENLRR